MLKTCDLGGDHDISPDYRKDAIDLLMEEESAVNPQDFTTCSLGFVHPDDYDEDGN